MVELVGMVEAWQLTPRVTGSFPLEDFAQAFAAIAQRRARGKIVLTMT
jgi:NADPH2:quinone reductase